MKTRPIISILFVLFSFTISYAQNDSISIDFGNNLSDPYWNNITSVNSAVEYELINQKGYLTSYKLSVISAFSGINNSGTQTPDPALKIPGTGSGDSFYGNPVEFGNSIQPTGGVELRYLDPQKLYNLEIFSSRMASDNRETKYVVIGQFTDSLFLQVANNTDSIVTISLNPAADGTIRIIASPGPNNNNTYNFFYLGVLRLTYLEEDPPGPPSLSIVSPIGGEYWQSGKKVDILWNSAYLPELILEFSADEGNSWSTIDTTASYMNSYTWTIPDTSSDLCKVRLRSDTLITDTPGNFEIGDDSSSCHIVVMGSSTAAGAGASPSDSSWVKRYTKAMYQRDTRTTLTNLAKGGYTTFHLVPTGTPIIPGIGIAPDTARNITKALSMQPYAVIVNLPSNDAAHYFGTIRQMHNFDLMAQAAHDAGADIWICTTQPRNFSNSYQIQIQEEVRDSILSIYGENAIDFWNGIADNNGYILPQYDAGDGVHLNNSGHRILFERVMEKNIDTLCAYDTSVMTDINTPRIESKLVIYPNPSSGNINIVSEKRSISGIMVIDMYGEYLYSRMSEKGIKNIRYSFIGKATGIYFVNIIFTDGNKTSKKIIYYK